MPDEKDFYKQIIDNLYDGVYFVNRDRVITYWNKGAERITGYSAQQTIGRGCRDKLLNHVTANGIELCMNNCPLAAVMEDGRPRETEVYVHHSDGYRLPVLVRATALRDEEGNIVGAIESFSNNKETLSARRHMHEMRNMAFTDPLTKVGNRRHLMGRLHAALAECKQNRNSAGLLFMDIDDFKLFNDTHGHTAGDKILCMVAATCQHALRATDTIGRWGGEEFVLILSNIEDAQTLYGIANKIRMLVEHCRLDMEAQSLTVTVSIGCTLLRPDDTPESLLERADKLMYQGKGTGKNLVTVG